MTERTHEEQTRLEAMRKGPTPPPDLEQRTLQHLRAEGLVHRRRVSPWMSAAAAFLLGLFAGGWRSDDANPNYVLFLYGGETPAQDEAYARVREYGDWASALRDHGVSITGERLGSVQSAGEREVALIDPRGYFLFHADTEEQAAEIARGCPHLRYGGSISWARIED